MPVAHGFTLPLGSLQPCLAAAPGEAAAHVGACALAAAHSISNSTWLYFVTPTMFKVLVLLL